MRSTTRRPAPSQPAEPAPNAYATALELVRGAARVIFCFLDQKTLSNLDRLFVQEIETMRSLRFASGGSLSVDTDTPLHIHCLKKVVSRLVPPTPEHDRFLDRARTALSIVNEHLLTLDGHDGHRLDRHFSEALEMPISDASQSLRTITAVTVAIVMLYEDVDMATRQALPGAHDLRQISDRLPD